MKTLIFGSCRVKRFRAYINKADVKKSISICQHHLHNPYEVHQLLRLIANGDVEFLQKYTKFHNEVSTRTAGLVDNYYMNLIEHFNAADRIIIEISSVKRLTVRLNDSLIDSNLTSISYLKKHEPTLLSSLEESVPKFNFFEEAIREIKELVGDKKLLIVPHYSWLTKDGPLRSRDLLRSQLLECCNLLKVDVLDPDLYLLKFSDRDSVCLDSSHYTQRFERLIARFFEKFF